MTAKREDTYRLLPTDKLYDARLRPDYRVDYARVIHAPAFRRLQNKTQLFPGGESDFFRNRLTHSLEVAQIAKSIAIMLKGQYQDADIEPDVCEIAGLLHDIGHPPFGHNGEAALDECMREKSGGFEGNAQTLRIITRLEKKEQPLPKAGQDDKDNRVGLNLTARVIASVLKYDREIPLQRNLTDSVVKGYYHSESDVIKKIKSKLLGLPNNKILGALQNTQFKTIECSIMDLADDIAYSTYDIEDAFKAGFLNPHEIMSANERVMENISVKLLKSGICLTAKECRELIISFFVDVWKSSVDDIKAAKRKHSDADIVKALFEAYKVSKVVASDGYHRTRFTSSLIQIFIDGIEFVPHQDFPLLSKVHFKDDVGKIVEILKHTTYETQIESARLKVAENRGKDIVMGIFNKLNTDAGHRLLPEDFQDLLEQETTLESKSRVICDFVAGMTDRYALEFYGRLHSESPQSIFVPL